MRADNEARKKRALELDAAGVGQEIIAERLGYSKSGLREMLKRAKRAAAKE